MSESKIKIATDHGFPYHGEPGEALEAFKNERDYIAQSKHNKTTPAAMDWAIREIARLRALATEHEELSKIIDTLPAKAADAVMPIIRAEVAVLRTINARLLAALKPFATIPLEQHATYEDDVAEAVAAITEAEREKGET